MYNLCYFDLSPSITDYQSISYKTINRIPCKKTESGKTLGRVDLINGISLYILCWHAYVPLVMGLRNGSVWWEFKGTVLESKVISWVNFKG